MVDLEGGRALVVAALIAVLLLAVWIKWFRHKRGVRRIAFWLVWTLTIATFVLAGQPAVVLIIGGSGLVLATILLIVAINDEQLSERRRQN